MPDQEPKALPPSADPTASQDGVARPSEEPPAEALLASEGNDSMPQETPPAESAAVGAFGAVWLRGKKIDALWSINENRNSWVHVAGVGWKKLASNSDSVVVALTMASAHARQTNSTVDLKEDGGQITEMSVW